jgi:hypothetical protein
VTRISRTVETNASRRTSSVIGSALLMSCSEPQPPRDAAHVHLELDVDDGWAAQVPVHPVDGRGADAAEELTALTREVEALTAGLDVSEADRLARLDAIAELAALVVPVEQQACAALAGRSS